MSRGVGMGSRGVGGGGVRETGEVGGGGGGRWWGRKAEGCRSGDFRWLWFPATVFLAHCFHRSVGYLCNEIFMECVRVTYSGLLAETGNQCRRKICVVITVI